MASRAQHAARPGRESLSKRLGSVARRIALRDGHACVYCGATAEQSGTHLHLDHLTPRAKGGLDVATNIRVCCRRCNSAKQDMSLAQWSAYAQVKLGLVFSPRTIRAGARRALPEVS